MTYDLAFSIGAACHCSICLRTADLQLASFPFDWLTRGPVALRAKIIASGFAGWIAKEDFTYLGRNEVNGLGRYRNEKTGIVYLHDFSDGPVEDSYDAVREKYARRTARLLRLLGKSRRVLALYVDSSSGREGSHASADELSAARRTLAAAFPGAAFDVVHFRHRPGVAPEAAVIERPCEGIVEVSFDYYDPVTNVRFHDVAKILRGVLGVRVRDYRTRKERKAYERRRLEKKYGKLSGLALAKARFWAVLAKLAAPFTRT